MTSANLKFELVHLYHLCLGLCYWEVCNSSEIIHQNEVHYHFYC